MLSLLLFIFADQNFERVPNFSICVACPVHLSFCEFITLILAESNFKVGLMHRQYQVLLRDTIVNYFRPLLPSLNATCLSGRPTERFLNGFITRRQVSVCTSCVSHNKYTIGLEYFAVYNIVTIRSPWTCVVR